MNNYTAEKAGESDFAGLPFDGWVAVFTAILTIATGLLWWETKALAKDANRQHRASNRAFIFIDGFDQELTVVTDEETGALRATLPEIKHPELYVTRFAIQPRWKNSGTTPTRNMRIRVNWRGPLGPIPPDYDYRGDLRPFFVAPQAVQASEVVEIMGVNAIINDGFPHLGEEPHMFLWGRADYQDVFGAPHFIEWCYRLRFDDHAGKGLRASFIQWGDYNRSDNT